MIRRDLLKFGGGAAAGIAFTPIPWRLLGDTAMWSQNWSWMPRVPRGEVADKDARCTLCSAACAVKARCADGVPIGLWPRESALCPAGFVAHHVAFHPIRLRSCVHRGQPAKIEDALQAAAARISGGGSVAVLDLQPGRTASLIHRRHIARLHGSYLVPPMVEGATAAAIQSLLAQPVPLAAALSDVKTVLSLSTPLLDGWAAPGRVSKPNRKFRLIQAEARRSRTARLADEWIAIRPGSETALALGIAHCLLKDPRIRASAASLDGFAEWARAAEAMSPVSAAQSTGIEAARIENLAHQLACEAAMVIADGDPIGGPLGSETQFAAAALNVMLGLRGFKQRPAVPASKDWAGVEETPLARAADGSISLLLIDEPAPGLAAPWSLIAKKLAHDAVVIALTWNQPHFAAHADYLVPVPVHLEVAQDAAPAHDSAEATFSLSPALLTPLAGTMHAADFVAKLAGDEVSFANRLNERIQAIGADQKELEAGGQWTATAPASPVATVRRILPAGMTDDLLLAAAQRTAEPVQLLAYGWRAAAVSPLLGKLWQESELRDAPKDVAAHPDTLRTLNLAEGRPALLDSRSGRLPVNVSSDANLPRGLVTVSGGPALSQICEPDSSGAWRVPGAKVVPA